MYYIASVVQICANTPFFAHRNNHLTITYIYTCTAHKLLLNFGFNMILSVRIEL